MSVQNFKNQIKTCQSSLATITNTKKSVINYTSEYIRQIEVTLDNTNKSVKTNYSFPVKINHKELVDNKKASYTFNDLRVYDSDEVTELDFDLEATNSNYCQVWVKIPSISATTKKIYFKFGNPIIEAKKQQLYPELEYPELEFWLKSNEAYALKNNRADNGEYVTQINNKGTGSNNPLIARGTISTAPADIIQSSNNLPILNCKTVGRPYGNSVNGIKMDKRNTGEFTIFAVAKASSQANYQSMMRFQSGSGTFVSMGWVSTGNALCISSADGGTTGINLGAVNNTWNILTARRKPNTTDGFNSYRNGAFVAARNSTATIVGKDDLRLFFLLNGNTEQEFFSGEVGDMLYFNKYLTQSELQSVTDYLNKKFQYWDTSDFPSISLSSVQELTNNVTSDDYSPFSTYSTYSKFSKEYYGIAYSEAKTSTMQMLKKVFATGASFESWSNSIPIKSDKLSVKQAQVMTITSTVSLSQHSFRRIIGSVDAHNLANYYYTDITNNTTIYSSKDIDYIEFELYIENISNFDLINSKIVFVGFTPSPVSKAATLNLNNNLYKNGKNIVKIKKKQFTGSNVSWSLFSSIRVELKTISGSQIIEFGNFQLIKNWDNDIELLAPTKIELANKVLASTTYSKSILFVGQIVSRYVNAQNIELKINDYLEIIRKLQFNELPAFPESGVINISITDKAEFYNIFLNTVLLLAFPDTFLDVSIQLSSDDKDILNNSNYNQNIPHLQFLTLKGYEKIGDKIDECLEAIFGRLYFNPETLKIEARIGYNNIANYNNSIDSSYEILDNYIISYDTDSSESEVINKINLAVYSQVLFQRVSLISNANQSIELKSGIQTLFFDNFEDKQIIEYKMLNEPILLNFYTALEAGGDIANRNFADVEILSVEAVNEKVKIVADCKVPKLYLENLLISGDYVCHFSQDIQFNNQNGLKKLYTTSVQNNNSIVEIGEKSLDLTKNFYLWGGFFTNQVFSLVYDSFLDFSSKNKIITRIETIYLPDIKMGQVVELRNEKNNLIKGIIYELEHTTKGAEFRTKLTIVEL